MQNQKDTRDLLADYALLLNQHGPESPEQADFIQILCLQIPVRHLDASLHSLAENLVDSLFGEAILATNLR